MAMSSQILVLSILLVAGWDVGIGEYTADQSLGMSGFLSQESLTAQGIEVPVASMYSRETMGASAPVPLRGIAKVEADATPPSSSAPRDICAR